MWPRLDVYRKSLEQPSVSRFTQKLLVSLGDQSVELL
jgi:hypothetical protein